MVTHRNNILHQDAQRALVLDQFVQDIATTDAAHELAGQMVIGEVINQQLSLSFVI